MRSSLVKVGWDFGAFVAVIAALVAFAPLASSAADGSRRVTPAAAMGAGP